MSEGPVVIQRTVEWPDTDASGHYHHSAVLRWVEAAEAVLHERLELPDLVARLPRVHYEVDYVARLWFRDRVQVKFSVADVGTTSVRYEFTVTRGEEVAARGVMVCVYSEPHRHESTTTPWPEWMAQALRRASASNDGSG